jgi:hypothetical protein
LIALVAAEASALSAVLETIGCKCRHQSCVLAWCGMSILSTLSFRFEASRLASHLLEPYEAVSGCRDSSEFKSSESLKATEYRSS